MKKIYDEYDKNKFIEVRDEFIFVKGGDGTLLKAIHLFKDLKLPFFGSAAGTVNFLMNKEDKLLKNYKIKKFRLLNAKIYYNNNEMIELEAFNEMMIGNDMNSWIEFDVKDKDDILGKFKGGGLIISTAQGSTGINKNNGGVILPLSSKNWVITGDKTNKYINKVLEPHKLEIKVKSRRIINCWLDGNYKKIENVNKVIITKGSKVKLIFNNYKEFKQKRR